MPDGVAIVEPFGREISTAELQGEWRPLRRFNGAPGAVGIRPANDAASVAAVLERWSSVAVSVAVTAPGRGGSTSTRP